MKPEIDIMNDLEYIAQRGFEQIPLLDADMEDLTKRIRKRTFTYNSARYFSFISLITGVFIGISVFVAFYRSPLSHFQLISNLPTQDSVVESFEEKITGINLDTITVEKENFERKIVVPIPANTGKDSDLTDSTDETAIYIPSQGIDISGTLSQSVKEEKIKFIINAPVFYLHDLKITDYTTLYFKKNQFVRLDGTSATYANKIETNQQVLHFKESPEYYLHKEIAEAMRLFKKGEYDLCINTLNLISTYNKRDVNCDFYLGMCYYNKKNYKKALHYFEESIGNQNNTFLQEATFYKALSLLSSGDNNSAGILLKQIAEEGEFYAEKAKAMLSAQND